MNKILIIDRDAEFIGRVKGILERFEHEVFSASTPGDVSKHFASGYWPDVILYEMRKDLHQAETSQLDALKIIQDHQSGKPFCYLLFLLNTEGKAQMVQGKQYGANDFLEKTLLNPGKLKRKIEKGLRYASLIRSIEQKKLGMKEKALSLERIKQISDKLLGMFRKLGEEEHFTNLQLAELMEGLHIISVEASGADDAPVEVEKTVVETKDQAFKVMVVDDNKNFLKLIEKALTKDTDLNVTTASSGEDAIYHFKNSLLTGSPFRLILMDIVMPGIGGIDALKKIREIEKERKTPRSAQVEVAMISANDDRKTMLDSHGAGCNRYIVKPFHINEAKQLIQKIKTQQLRSN